MPNTEVDHLGTSEALSISPQPNVLAAEPDAPLMTSKMWVTVTLAEVGWPYQRPANEAPPAGSTSQLFVLD